MASLTFPELQQKMQLEKRKSKDVKYAFRKYCISIERDAIRKSRYNS